MEGIRQGVRGSQVVENRITQAYQLLPPDQAHIHTKQDRMLLKAQVTFLDQLGG